MSDPSNLVCTDDYGEQVFRCERGFVGYLWASEAKLMRSYYPGVRGTEAVHQNYDVQAEIDAFHENDANCNTCRHLIRVPFTRNRPSSLMSGKCGLHHNKPDITFHPDDWMGMKCWERRPKAGCVAGCAHT